MDGSVPILDVNQFRVSFYPDSDVNRISVFGGISLNQDVPLRCLADHAELLSITLTGMRVSFKSADEARPSTMKVVVGKEVTQNLITKEPDSYLCGAAYLLFPSGDEELGYALPLLMAVIECELGKVSLVTDDWNVVLRAVEIALSKRERQGLNVCQFPSSFLRDLKVEAPNTQTLFLAQFKRRSR